MDSPHHLSGKKAFVTGGKRRIGRGIALAFAAAGCDVGINDIDDDDDARETLRLIRAMGREAEFFAGDISDSTQVAAMFATFITRFGRIDILANNPYGGAGQHFLELTEDNWDANLDIGLKGFYLCSQQAARAMVAQGDGGAIVSTSSVHGRRAWKTDAAYGAAKAGVLRLTESMAVDLGEHSIRCNAILPGRIHTPFVDGFISKNYPGREEEIFKKLSEYQPCGRMGKPEEVAAMAVFLCSDEASFITGVGYPVDGGTIHIR